MPKRFRAWLAKRLRYFADRIDYEHAWVGFPAYFYMKPGEGIKVVQTKGIQVQPPVNGVPLWYRVDDYPRAWREEDYGKAN